MYNLMYNLMRCVVLIAAKDCVFCVCEEVERSIYCNEEEARRWEESSALDLII